MYNMLPVNVLVPALKLLEGKKNCIKGSAT